MTCRLIFSVLLVCPSLLLADILGVVSDPSGAPVAGAMVYLLGGTARSTSTDAAGRYRFAGPPAGKYTLVAGAPGLSGRPVAIEHRPGDDDAVNLALELAARSETVVVTAERTELPAAVVASATTVLSRRELEEMHAENVAEALRYVPGLVVNQTARRGVVASLFARGANSNMNLVLVDGVPVNDFGGAYNLANLPVENVERLEVVRGPQSALYGANAIGAVIQVITRRGVGPPQFRAQAEGGSFHFARASLGAGARTGRLAWNVDFSRTSSDGIVINDDYRNETASWHASYDLGAAARFSYSFTANANESGGAGPFGSNPIGAFEGLDRITRGKENVYRHGFRYEMQAGRVRQRFDGGLYLERLDYQSPFGPSSARNFRGSIATQTELALAPNDALAFGFEYQREHVRNSYLADVDARLFPVRRNNFGYYAENRYERGGRLFLNTGVRLEDIRTGALPAVPFGPPSPRRSHSVVSVNPKVSAAFLPRANGAAKIHAGAGTGIRMPDGFELAFTDNPELKPERTTSFDVGVEQAFAGRRAVFDLTYFHNRFHDLIVTLGPGLRQLSRFQSDNLSNSRARGLEFSYAVRALRSLRIQGHHTWMKTELLSLDRAPGRVLSPFRVGQELLRRPEHSSAHQAVWRLGRFTFDAGAVIRSAVLDAEPNLGVFGGIFRNPGYVRPDAGLEIALSPEVAVYGRLRNFTDERYEESFGFPSLRRNFVAGMKFSWGAR